MRDAVDRDLRLLHGFEQGRLRLRRRAVDLVGHQDLGEHGPADEAKGGRLRVVDVRPHQVRRHEIGRELHARELQAEARRERPREQRLGDSGNAFDQRVAARHVGGEQHLGRPILSDHDLPDRFAHARRGGRHGLEPRNGFCRHVSPPSCGAAAERCLLPAPTTAPLPLRRLPAGRPPEWTLRDRSSPRCRSDARPLPPSGAACDAARRGRGETTRSSSRSPAGSCQAGPKRLQSAHTPRR